jgi:beta-glucosidase
VEVGWSWSVEMTVGLKDFAYFDEKEKMWKVDKGQYDFSFGQSAAHIESVVIVDVAGTSQGQVKL